MIESVDPSQFQKVSWRQATKRRAMLRWEIMIESVDPSQFQKVSRRQAAKRRAMQRWEIMINCSFEETMLTRVSQRESDAKMGGHDQLQFRGNHAYES
eukprot:1161614-Pelagomonas_calceolata.AAC.1